MSLVSTKPEVRFPWKYTDPHTLYHNQHLLPKHSAPHEPQQPSSRPNARKSAVPVGLVQPIDRSSIPFKSYKFPTAVLAHILSYLSGSRHERNQMLVTCMVVSRQWHMAASQELYRDLRFIGYLSHVCLESVLRTLSNFSVPGSVSNSGYARFIKVLHINQIADEEPLKSRFNSWTLVKQLLSHCSNSLEFLLLSAVDDSFQSMSDAGLESSLVFPKLRTFQVSAKCIKFSESFILDLLRKAPNLENLHLPYCLPELSSTMWWWIAERGPLLKTLVVPPAHGTQDTFNPNVYQAGLLAVVEQCPNLSILNVSNHRKGIDIALFELLLRSCPDLSELVLPCGLGDPHLLLLKKYRPKLLHKLSLSCSCDCMRQLGTHCNTISTVVVRSLLEEVFVGRYGSIVALPKELIYMRTGKRIPTIPWLEKLPTSRVSFADTDSCEYLGILVHVPGGRLHAMTWQEPGQQRAKQDGDTSIDAFGESGPKRGSWLWDWLG
ncbi:uncharacterized protein BJ171DRAFT_503907 [Polychytrium aggregatum]|uniref:uncharacterized protein n=1 Tax=Polychytrium aggregatum TaxID=110093 RepID=UPI0022FE7B44|nr:uncharacterized protein BJ171DRAFT_503907 [Polychytrium aggregatum]KAI9204868.1 hypothetical protein BJ171DRAFT_503907 [Polychytrium aggregatum]